MDLNFICGILSVTFMVGAVVFAYNYCLYPWKERAYHYNRYLAKVRMLLGCLTGTTALVLLSGIIGAYFLMWAAVPTGILSMGCVMLTLTLVEDVKLNYLHLKEQNLIPPSQLSATIRKLYQKQ